LSNKDQSLYGATGNKLPATEAFCVEFITKHSLGWRKYHPTLILKILTYRFIFYGYFYDV